MVDGDASVPSQRPLQARVLLTHRALAPEVDLQRASPLAHYIHLPGRLSRMTTLSVIVDGEREYVRVKALAVREANRAAGAPDERLTHAIDQLLAAVGSRGDGDPIDHGDVEI